MKRREFMKTLAAVPAACGAAAAVPAGSAVRPAPAAAYDLNGLPGVVFGKTGVTIPRLGIGCGSRFCAVKDPETSVAILTAALASGFYYWDTAYSYRAGDVVSQERLGLVLKDRRSEVFLATKLDDRTRDGARRQFEESLKRLRTDRVDLLQVHLVASRADAEALGAKGGALEALRQIRDEGAARFLGFTGHLSAEAMAETARRYDFDTMLIALNHYQEVKGDMEGGAVPVAAGKGMGVAIIKAIRPRELVKTVSPEDLIRYGLSLPGVHAAVIGTDGVEIVRRNAEILRRFKPLTSAERSALREGLGPFFNDPDLPWLRPGYPEARSD